MEREILEILRTMQGDIKVMQGDIKAMQGDIKTMQGDIKTMQGDINNMKTDINNINIELKETNERLSRVEKKADNNTLLLENANIKIETIAEVQQSFSEQLGRSKDRDEESLFERLDIIKMAVSDTSFRTKNMERELTRVVRNTAENWADIVEIKTAR